MASITGKLNSDILGRILTKEVQEIDRRQNKGNFSSQIYIKHL